jgi:hypothetical protein
MKKYLLIFLFLLTVLATNWSLLHAGFFRVHDYTHAARIAEMLRALQDGQFPVRWTSNFGYGYGMPLFEFYAPLPFYVGALIYWLGVDIVATIKLLYLFSAVGAFAGMYLLGKRLTGRAGGILAAIALTTAPYRAVNLFVRGSLSEAWGIMALPWVLLGIVRVIRKEPYGWQTLVAGLVTLFLSHNITTLLFVPFSALFAVGYWLYVNFDSKHLKQLFSLQKIRPLFFLAPIYLLAIGLAAFYLFPALAEKDFTKINSILGGYFHYSHHFLYIRQFLIPNWGYGGSNWGPDDGLSFFLGYGQLFGMLITSLAMVISVVRLKKVSKQVSFGAFLGVLIALALFMSLLKSKPIWDMLPFMLAVQFPWRWLSVGITFLSLFVGWGTQLIPSRFNRYLYMIVLSSAMLVLNTTYFRPETYLQNAHDLYYTEADLIQKEMSGILPDYIPIQMNDVLIPPTELFLLPEGVEKQVEVLVNRGHQKLFKTTFTSPVFFNPMIADFPGWQVLIDEQPAEKTVGVLGTLKFKVPPGEHLVSVYWGATPVRQVSDFVSAMSLVVLLFILIPTARKKYDSSNTN